MILASVAIFEIGAVTGQVRWKMLATILAVWFVNSPLAATLGAGLKVVLQSG